MAQATGSSVDYVGLTALTKEQYVPKLVDNIKKKSVMLSRFLAKSTANASGNKIHQPIEYADSSAVGFYRKYDTLTIEPNENYIDAQYSWAQAHASITISGYEERVNASPEKLVDLLGAKMKTAEKSLAKKFSNVLFGSANTDDEQDFVSLRDVASQSDPAGHAGGLGGLAVGTHSWWKGAFEKDLSADTRIDSGTTADFDNFAINFDTIAREGWEAMSRDSGDRPSIIVGNQVIFDAYEQHLSDKKRTGMSSGELADAGFTNMMYRGVPLVVDPSCPAGDMYFINEDYLKMKHNRKANFSFTGFTAPVDQDVRTGHILWMGQMVCSNRAKAVGQFYGLPTDYTTVT